VNTIKTVFLAALLSAAAYGVYVGVTGSPPNFGSRRRAKDWEETADDVESAPLVSIGDDSPPMPGATAIPPAAAPAFNSVPPAVVDSGPDAVAPANSASPAAAGDSAADRYTSDQRYPSATGGMDSASAASPVSGDPLAAGIPTTTPEASVGNGIADRAYSAEASPTGHGDFAGLMQSVESLLAQNRLADAHLELSEWFGDEHFTPEQNAQVTNLLDQLAGTVIYSREHLLERAYEVQPGDTLDKIADLYDVTWQLLANINGIRDPRHVRPGQQLKVVKGPFNAYVNLSKFQLVLYLGDRYAGRFHIGVGQDQETPEGIFSVLQKVENPTYYGEPVIDKDDPQNPLGEYAIDLGNRIWIHGTNDPQSIGRADSRGCIRLANRDIKDIFEILTAKTDRTSGSLVQIKRY
jgi:LysM repeat protein